MPICKVRKLQDDNMSHEERLHHIENSIKKVFESLIEQNIDLKARSKKDLAEKIMKLMEDKMINDLHVDDYEINYFPDMRGPYIIRPTIHYTILDGKYPNHAIDYIITLMIPIGFKKDGTNFMIDRFSVKLRQGQVKEVEDINTYYRDSKQIKDNNYGWEISSDDAYDALMEYVDEVGAEKALDDLVLAMSHDELAANLEYIFRMNEFESQYLK